MKIHNRRRTQPLPVADDADDPYAHVLPDPYAAVLLARATEAHTRQREQDDDFAEGWAA